MFPRPAIFVVLVLSMLCGCKTKPSAAVYAGDSPTVHYHAAEAAGGSIKTKRYR